MFPSNANNRPSFVFHLADSAGKTTTVAETVYQLAKSSRQAKILLVAPSNDACDILVERLAAYFPPTEMRRILAYSRTVENMPKTIRQYATEGASAFAQCEEILSARIVVSTVNLAARFAYFGVPPGFFDVLLVDEAGHATEPEVIAVAATLLDTNKESSQVVLAGDPKQLGPVITSEVARSFGMSVSYMERLSIMALYSYDSEKGCYPPDLITELVRNYRSHPSIIRLPNEMFYENRLLCVGDVMTTHNMAKWEHLPVKGFPVLFHAMDGENLRESNSPSWFNPQEAQQVVSYVRLLLHETKPPVQPADIGIITPYARQAQKIRKALVSKGIGDEIKVGSVECFQGQERRCIIISTVRSEMTHVESDIRNNLGFVANKKRFNVAMTRAKALLVVVGCPSVLALDTGNWYPFLRYCHQNKSWIGDIEWDPDEAEAGDEIVTKENVAADSDWEVVVTPSRAVEEEAYGTGLTRREE
jgi:helicase MOV-10